MLTLFAAPVHDQCVHITHQRRLIVPLQAVAETGATSVKQMGAVMKVVMTKTQGQADNKLVSDLVKAALSK